jgi:hypothetical protein
VESPRYLEEVDRLCWILLAQDKAREAESGLRASLRIRERDEPGSWTTFQTRALLGAALAGQRRYAEATPLLRASHEALQQRLATLPADSRARLADTASRMARLLAAAGRREESNRWRGAFVAPAPVD